MERIQLPIPPEMLEAIDAARADVPRTVWIRRAIEQRLDQELHDEDPTTQSGRAARQRPRP